MAEAREHDPQALSSSHCLANRLGTLTDLASKSVAERDGVEPLAFTPSSFRGW
jgi:hypothetical protein